MDPLKAMTSFEPAKKAVSFYEDFKNFALKGNVIDLAIGVIIGAAFSKIVDSLVKNIIMPLISFVLPTDQGYQTWKLSIEGKDVLYGQFLGDVLNFLLVALVLFVFFVKFLGWMTRTTQAEPAPPPLTKDQELLVEIRDLLKKAPPAAQEPAGV